MYERHFSFKCKPFELTPNPDFLFLSNTHRKAMTFLEYGIRERIGFILLTGEVGSGKTTIIKNFIKTVDNPVKLSKVTNTKVNSEELLALINQDFGLDVEGKGKTKLLSDLNEFLIDLYARNYQPVLLIDEAQNLTPELLEEIRLLSNLETDRTKLLQIILVGQPELRDTIKLSELRQLRQRISINYHLTPLHYEEVGEYIRHRLKVAGNEQAFKIDEKMIDTVYKFSRGIPRLINILCDYGLITAYVEGKEHVTTDIIKAVASDLKEYDYWNENKAQSEKKGEISTHGKVVENYEEDLSAIALKIIKLEKKVDSLIEELSNLSNRCETLEREIKSLKNRADDRKIIEHLNHLEEKIVCRILMRVADENTIPTIIERIAKIEQKIENMASIDRQVMKEEVRRLLTRIEELEAELAGLEDSEKDRI